MTFLRLFKAELKKLARPHSLLILTIVLVVALILVIAVFSMFSVVRDVAGDENLFPDQSFEDLTALDVRTLFPDKAATELAIQNAEQSVRSIEAKRDDDPAAYYSASDDLYSAKAIRAAAIFVLENELYGQEIELYFGENGSLIDALVGAPSANDFTGFAMSFLSLILVVYMITVGAGIMSNELKSGSIKLLMLRPVTRNEVTSAKLAATALYGVALYTITLLIAFAYGAIRYGVSVSPTLYVFNASSAFLADGSFSLFLVWLSGVVSMLSFSLLAYTAGLLFKNAPAGVGVAVVSAFGVVGLLFNLFGGSRFLLSYQGNFTDYFSVESGSLYGGSDFFLMIGMLAVWWIVMLAASYAVFDRRDVV